MRRILVTAGLALCWLSGVAVASDAAADGAKLRESYDLWRPKAIAEIKSDLKSDKYKDDSKMRQSLRTRLKRLEMSDSIVPTIDAAVGSAGAFGPRWTAWTLRQNIPGVGLLLENPNVTGRYTAIFEMDSGGQADGTGIDLSNRVFIADRLTTYTTVIGSTKTVIVFRELKQDAIREFKATFASTQPSKAPCKSCNGTGETKCGKCHGTGKVKCPYCKHGINPNCWTCKGTGMAKCDICDGTGKIRCRKCAAK